MKNHVNSKSETFISLCENHFPSLDLNISFREELSKNFSCTIRVGTKKNHIEKFRLSHKFYDEIQSIFSDVFITKSKIIWDTSGIYGNIKFDFRPFSFYERCCIADFKDETEFKNLLFKSFCIEKKNTKPYDKLYEIVSNMVLLDINRSSSCKMFYEKFETLINIVSEIKK